MTKYAVEVEYLVPHYSIIKVEAASPEDACRKAESEIKAITKDGLSFEVEEEDYDNASPVYISSVWTDKFYSGLNVIPMQVKARSKRLRKQYIEREMAGEEYIETACSPTAS